jgi:hypothetical protein
MTRQVWGEVGGPQQAARRTVGVTVCHFEEVNDLPLIPDVVPGSDDVDAEIEEFLGQGRSNAETRGGVFSIRDDEVNGVIVDQRWQFFFDNGTARPSEDVADEEYAQCWPQK